MQIFQKRGRYCVKNKGKLKKFSSLAEAENYVAINGYKRAPAEEVEAEAEECQKSEDLSSLHDWTE